MSEWWIALSLEQQIYYAIAGVATGMLLLQTLLMLFAGMDDLVDAGDADMDGPSEHPSGIHVLSTRTIVAFFVGFGWTGVVASRHGIGEPQATAIAAALVGTLFGAAIFYLMRFLHGLQHSGSLDYRNAVGEVGTVYLPIPNHMKGSGRVQVMVQGRLKVIQALTRHPQPIENRARVRVIELVDETTLLVEPLAVPGGTEEDR